MCLTYREASGVLLRRAEILNESVKGSDTRKFVPVIILCYILSVEDSIAHTSLLVRSFEYLITVVSIIPRIVQLVIGWLHNTLWPAY